MRCLNPRTVGFLSDGKTISWSQKKYSREYATFKLPCSKCLECRLNYAREAAIRCIHEAQMHPENSFITLTYSDEHLDSPKLNYEHFQKFIKDLRNKVFRETTNQFFGEDHWKKLSKDEKKLHIQLNKDIYDSHRIGVFVTGEYGDKKKRPHWHAIIFNWSPKDLVYAYSNDRGDKIYNSEELTQLWGRGFAEVGSVTLESAGYVARYAAKKLTHGEDGKHDYNPIHKRSNKNAIGKKFIEKYYTDIFSIGCVILPGGTKASIPRYYEKWLKQHKYEDWIKYLTNIKLPLAKKMEEDFNEERHKEEIINQRRVSQFKGLQTKRSQSRKIILEQKFKRLQEARKGD